MLVEACIIYDFLKISGNRSSKMSEFRIYNGKIVNIPILKYKV